MQTIVNGSELRKARRAAGLSAVELGAMVGLSHGAITALERKQMHGEPLGEKHGWRTRAEIARVLNVAEGAIFPTRGRVDEDVPAAMVETTTSGGASALIFPHNLAAGARVSLIDPRGGEPLTRDWPVSITSDDGAALARELRDAAERIEAGLDER